MIRHLNFSLAIACLLSIPARGEGTAPRALRLTNLRCEYMTNPPGVDASRPRLSWVLESDRRGERQTAYQVLVASTPELLHPAKADLWDSGRVESGRSVHVLYDGKPLRSAQRAWWRVRVWAQCATAVPAVKKDALLTEQWHAAESQPTAVSESAWWEMGLLTPQDWTAQWISAAAPEDTARAELLGDARWIWTPEGDPSVVAPEGERFFRLRFTLRPNVKPDAVRIAIVVDDEFVAYLNGKQIGDGSFPEPTELTPGDALHEGENLLAVRAKNHGGTAGLIARIYQPEAQARESEPEAQARETFSRGLKNRAPLRERIPVDRDARKDSRTSGIEPDVQARGISHGAWKCSKKDQPGWEQPDFDDSKWEGAKELGAFGCRPWGQLNQPRKVDPAPHFRKTFTLHEKVKSARAYVAGLGYYELYLNGEKVGDHVLDPAFTRYDRRVLYVTYDVTGQLHSGENAVGAILGNGWYNHHAQAVWSFDKAPWRDHPCLRMQLEVTYHDGSREMIVSDESWTTAAGPIRWDGLFCGETYDARLEMPGWATADYKPDPSLALRPGKASKWRPVHVVPGPKGIITAQRMPPIKIVQTITPVKLTQPKPGTWVYDMGQAFAGWAQLRIAGPAGCPIRLKYGERLNANGTVDQSGIAAHFRQDGFQTDTYILSGHGPETWEPRFNYHAFRWVEVTVYPPEPDNKDVKSSDSTALPKPPPIALTLDSLRGRVVHTAFEPAGMFECSNPLLNKILECTRWSYGANFHGYPTDCPHREKNGWTGDAHLAAEQAMYNFNNVPGYEKWLRDLKDEQRDGGELPGIVPTSGWGYHWGNGPAWDSAYVLIPWYLYEYYGDAGVLAEHYDRMKRYVDYLTSRARDGIVDFGLGDWVPAKTKTPVELTSTAYYYVDALIVSKAATILAHGILSESEPGLLQSDQMKRLLEKRMDAEKYAALAEGIKTAFNAKFYDATKGTYANGSQTALSCALYQGLVPEDQQDRVLEALVRNVREQDNHLDCGILGTKYLLHALTDGSRADMAYSVASQKTFPSWGYWIENGATTLWEDWKGESSRMHVMFGDVAAWMYSGLAGIRPDPDKPGFEHIFIRPNPVGDLTWAKAEYDSIRGKIISSWRRDGGTFKLDVTIPPGATATLYLPAAATGKVTESGVPAGKSAGVQFLRTEPGRCVYTLASGKYRFAASN